MLETDQVTSPLAVGQRRRGARASTKPFAIVLRVQVQVNTIRYKCTAASRLQKRRHTITRPAL